MISISRPIDGISLNGDEYLLDENNEVMLFSDKEEAMEFLRNSLRIKYTDEQLEEAFNFNEE